MSDPISHIRTMIWTVLLVLFAANIGLGIFNVNMLRDNRHIAFISTGENCQAIVANDAAMERMEQAQAVLPAMNELRTFEE